MARKVIDCKVIGKKVNPETWDACINNFDCDSCQVPVKRKQPQERNQPERRALGRWLDAYLPSVEPPPWEGAFYKSSLNKIQKIIGIKTADDEAFVRELASYTLRFTDLIDFEIRIVPTRKHIQHEIEKLKSPTSRLPSRGEINMLMGVSNGGFASLSDVPLSLRKTTLAFRAIDLSNHGDKIKGLLGFYRPSPYDRETLHRMLNRRIELLPEGQVLNRPLYGYVFMLAVFYERWSDREVRRANKNKRYRINKRFYDFVAYLMELLGLSKVWGRGSTDKAIQKVIERYLLPLRARLKENESPLSLRDIDPSLFPRLPENLIEFLEDPVGAFVRDSLVKQKVLSSSLYSTPRKR